MFQPGQEIGPYTLVKRLGRGGFGEVWLAERRAKFVTTKVAVKLPLDSQIDHETIKQEALLWEQASGHPNVLPIIDADEYAGQIVIVSEYAPDGSLDDLLKNEGVLPAKKAVELTMGILGGLEFLHSKKIIHRDIKPANILLQGETPRLADFGISRIMKNTSVSVNMSGTPTYMAPEAFDRKRNVQTDIWSVGVILYQMLKGDLPFPFENLTDLLGALILREPEPLPESVAPALRAIILKSLAKDPSNRFRAAREMREALAGFLLGAAAPPAITPAGRRDDQTDDAPAAALSLTERDLTPAPPKNSGQTPVGSTFQNLAEPDTAGRRPPRTGEAFNLTAAKAGAPPNKARNGWLIAAAALLVLIPLGAGGWFLLNYSQLFPPPATDRSAGSGVSAGSVETDDGPVPYRKGNKFGFSDRDKRIVIAPKYEAAFPFNRGVAIVMANGRLGVVDKTGRELVPPKYDELNPFDETGLATFRLGDRWGAVDLAGTEVVGPKYEYLSPFADGRAIACVAKKCGLIDRRANFVVAPKYDSIAFRRQNGGQR